MELLAEFSEFSELSEFAELSANRKVAGLVKIQFDGVEGDESGLGQGTGLKQKEGPARDRLLR